MPEGDVVWQAARRLHKALAGRTLTRSDFRVPRLATVDLTGDVVTETASRGNHPLTPRTPSPSTPPCGWTATGGCGPRLSGCGTVTRSGWCSRTMTGRPSGTHLASSN